MMHLILLLLFIMICGMAVGIEKLKRYHKKYKRSKKPLSREQSNDKRLRNKWKYMKRVYHNRAERRWRHRRYRKR